MVDYLDVSHARDLPGLRLVLTAGVPGPWGEAAKGILHVKQIAYQPVRQDAGQPNDALREWTGHDNAPQAIYADEAARTGWVEILLLAERLAPTPSLLPEDAGERASALGLAHEICGEEGLGWSRRLMMLAPAMSLPEDHPVRPLMSRLAGKYGYSDAAAKTAPARVAAILRMLGETLGRQRDAGRRYLVGEQLTAVDIYWAAFAAMLSPLPADLCPMPDRLRLQYTATEPLLLEALEPALLEHRDFVYREHLALPLQF